MMKALKSILLILLSSVAILFQAQNAIGQKNTTPTDSYVLLISLDAYRWDYPDVFNTPSLRKLASEGVKAKSLISCYPSKTFPNHYSIATGLHPDHHGIVNNSFYDEKLGYYALGDRKSVENGAFYLGEPIWITAQKQGVKCASYFWVGSEAPIQGMQPTYWKKYSKKTTFEDKIDTVIHWFSLPEDQRPHLVTFYHYQPDWTSHDFGPLAKETRAVAEQLDSLIGVFMDKLRELPIASKINVIVVSDHGMADISNDRYINLSDNLSKDWFSVISGGNPVYSLQPKPEFYQEALEKLKKIDHLKVWERNDIPKRYVYGTSSRVNDILIEADLGWSVAWVDDKERFNGGTHGYDNMLPEMQGIFFAKGPAFKQGYIHESFMNIDIYPIISKILGIQPAKVDGNIDEVEGIFK
ncbi:alkaline phosphatase family protein [Tenuifilaceae bacterium CYCD]|nr:alkaline phosphatase family protein [Tenuifilaceae bacterium CYCD]